MNPESPRLASVHSTPVADGTASSDIESAVSLNNKRSDADIPVSENHPAPVHPEFAFPDGNIEIQTIDQIFWVHEYHLNKFAGFATLIQAAKSSVISDPGCRIIVACDRKVKGEDIYNTLKVIYASHIDGIPDFDSSTMVSTLRIASTFAYPALRKFATSKLEGMSLPAIQRIQLSDEFSLPSWETPAFTELCNRKEPISQVEAEILGMTRFVEVARIREIERTRLAVKFAGGIYGELLQTSELASSLQSESSSDSGTIQDTFEYSSGRSALPACTYRASQSRLFQYVIDDPAAGGSHPANHCSLHKVAPQVLKEGQTLLKQRDELRVRLGNIRSAFNCRIEREDSPPTLDVPDLAMELSRASWIRRECAAAS